MHTMAMDGTALRVLHLQNNFLDFRNIEEDLDKASPFQNLNRLEILNMRNNSMRSFLNDWNIENYALQVLDLSYNHIEMIDFGNIFNIWIEAITIDVSNNNITTVSAAKNFAAVDTESQVKWILNDNPLKCDCLVIHFANYLQHQTHRLANSPLKFITDRLECVSPQRFVKKRLENVPLADLVCPLDKENANDKKCPDGCSCFVRTIDSTAVFNCSNANLTKVPALPSIQSLGLQFYELHIENNNITALPLANTTGYKNVNRLFAKNNSMETILPNELPNNLYALDLSANKMKRIHPGVLLKLNHMQNLQNVSFGRNPWVCDCTAYELMKFIENHFQKMAAIDEITCNNDKSLTLTNASGLCPIEPTTILIILIAAIVAVSLLTTTLYYKNQQEILVWMFAHNGCAWFFNTKPKSDDHKKYDAFVLYSPFDEKFVHTDLVPQLENGPKPLNVCLLIREIKGGDIIPEQVTNLLQSHFIWLRGFSPAPSLSHLMQIVITKFYLLFPNNNQPTKKKKKTRLPNVWKLHDARLSF